MNNPVAKLYAVLFQENGDLETYPVPFASDMEFEDFYEALPVGKSARLFGSLDEANRYVMTH